MTAHNPMVCTEVVKLLGHVFKLLGHVFTSLVILQLPNLQTVLGPGIGSGSGGEQGDDARGRGPEGEWILQRHQQTV